jgi:hypothetical protein
MTDKMRTDGIQSRLGRLRERAGGRLLVLLTALIAFWLFVVAPLHAAGMLHSNAIGPVLLVVLFAGVLTVSASPLAVAAMFVAAAATGTAFALRLLNVGTAHIFLDAMAIMLLGLAVGFAIARAVFAPGRVTYHRVVGAVLLYLTIGLTFVALFTMVFVVSPQAFSGLASTGEEARIGSVVYYSFVTLTSVGYGDILPVHPLARSLSNVEAIIGQLYPATLLARLVSLEIAHSDRE